MLKLIVATIILIIVLIAGVSFLYFVIKSTVSPQKTAPYIWTFKRHLKILKQLNIKKWSKMLDLGCWDGKALRFFDKTYELKKWVWYDINPFAIIRWKIINILKWYKHIHIYKKNFLKIELKWYTYIYVYLRPSQLKDIEERIRKNKDKQTIIISNSFQFIEHKPYKIFKDSRWKEAIFLYK